MNSKQSFLAHFALSLVTVSGMITIFLWYME